MYCMYVCIYRCSSRISSSRNSSGEESALTDALVPTPLPSKFFLFFFFFLISILRQGMAFVSSRSSSPFIFVLRTFFFYTPQSAHFFGQRFSKLPVSLCPRKGIRIYVSRPATSLVVLAGRLFVFRSTATPKINFDSAFVCLVDWQRCTQAVTRVYERE